MISIKAFWEREEKDLDSGQKRIEQANALMQALHILIEGLPCQGVKRVLPGSGGLQRASAELLRRLDVPTTAFDILEVASEAVSALEQDMKETSELYRLQNEELQSMIAMLTDTVASLSVENDGSIGRLQRIEKQIERVSMLDDMRALKSSLSECLEAVREASAQQQKQSVETIQRFEYQIEGSKARMAAVPRVQAVDLDLVTDDSFESKDNEYAVVFSLDRDDLIAARFSQAARHEVLAFVRGRLRTMLMPSDRVIRWNGGAYVALIRRRGSIRDVRAEMANVAGVNSCQYFNFGNKSVLLRISMSWKIFPQAQFGSLDVLFKSVDEFLVTARKVKPNATDSPATA